jgi:ABC-type nitrate/sulfonate/bicarbonate transport system permease component
MSGIVPGILSGLFLIIWLPDSEYSKYIFIFFASFLYLFNKAEYDLTKVRGEYVDAVVSLGAGKNFVFDKVSWKFIEPALAESLPDLHFHLWSILIVFEFIKGGSGLGSILRTVVLYRDIAGLFVSILIISLLILIGTAMIKYIKNKIYLLEY